MDKILKKLKRNKSQSKEAIGAVSKESIATENKPVNINKNPDELDDGVSTPSTKMYFRDIPGYSKGQRGNKIDKSKSDSSLKSEDKRLIEELQQKLQEVKQRLEDEKKQNEALKQAIEDQQRNLDGNQPKGILKKTTTNTDDSTLQFNLNQNSENPLNESGNFNVEIDTEGNFKILPLFKDATDSFSINFNAEGVTISSATDGSTSQNNYSVALANPSNCTIGYTSLSKIAHTEVQNHNFDSGYYHPKQTVPKWDERQYNSYWVPAPPPRCYNPYSYGANSNLPSNFTSASSYNSSTYGSQMGTGPSYTLPCAPSFSCNPPPVYRAPSYRCLRHREKPNAGCSYRKRS